MNLDAGEVLLYSGHLITSADEAARREDQVGCARSHVLAFFWASATVKCEIGSGARDQLARQLPWNN